MRLCVELLLGPRGSGKTVTLNMVENLAYEAGWLVLPLDSSTPNITGRLEESIEWASEEFGTAPNAPHSHAESTSRGFRLLGAEWHRQVVRSIEPKWGLRRQLTTMAEHAAQQGSAVLLTVDELHSANLNELRRLSSDLQHITKREQRPLAFVGAGLSEMRHTLLEDKKMTFFQRCHSFDMPSLTSSDVMRCLSKTVRDADGEFADGALKSLADASGPLPFRMQLLGFYAWTIADAPMSPIDDNAATLAIGETDADMHRRVHSPTWHSLNDHEQAFLLALNELGGEATPRQIAGRIGNVSPSSIARADAHLVDIGCIVHASGGLVAFGPVMAHDSVARFAEQEAQYTDAGVGEAAMNEAGSTADRQRRRSGQRCNKHMPRANARCILSAGHAGRCRSC